MSLLCQLTCICMYICTISIFVFNITKILKTNIEIVLYYIVSIHLYSTSYSAHQSEALPVRETQGEESSLERTRRGTWLTS